MQSNLTLPPHNLPSSASFVALRTPLPCVTDAHGSGFVHAIARDRFLIQFAAPKTLPEKNDKLTITTEHGNLFSFQAEFESQGTDGMVQVRLPSDHGSDASRLNDLLNILRKSQHITICNNEDVEAKDKYTGFSDVRLLPCSLPDFDIDEIDTSARFLGMKFAWPLFITGMTGGLEQGAQINLRLARAASKFQIPMGVGSQRIALENSSYERIFAVKESVPDVFLIGNIGMAQLHDVRDGDPVAACRRAVKMIGADALAIHLNVLQELIQVEGDRHFRGITQTIGEVAAALDVPVIIKEVGCGVDQKTARTLFAAGVAAIDCGGKGGTSWSHIEGMRAHSSITKNLGATFRDWGIPTAVSTILLRREFPDAQITATGGIRDGLTAASAVAIGATMAGIGLPLLRAAVQSEQAVQDVLEEISSGFKIAMAASGARTIADLRTRARIKAALVEQLAEFSEGPLS